MGNFVRRPPDEQRAPTPAPADKRRRVADADTNGPAGAGTGASAGTNTAVAAQTSTVKHDREAYASLTSRQLHWVDNLTKHAMDIVSESLDESMRLKAKTNPLWLAHYIHETHEGEIATALKELWDKEHDGDVDALEHIVVSLRGELLSGIAFICKHVIEDDGVLSSDAEDLMHILIASGVVNAVEKKPQKRARELEDTHPASTFYHCVPTSYRLGKGANGTVYGTTVTWRGKKVAKKVVHDKDYATGRETITDKGMKAEFMLQCFAAMHGIAPTPLTLYKHNGNWEITMVQLVTTLGNLLEPEDAKDLLSDAEIDTLTTRKAELARQLRGLGLYQRDLHDSNIMLDFDGRMLIVDYGLVCSREWMTAAQWERACSGRGNSVWSELSIPDDIGSTFTDLAVPWGRGYYNKCAFE